MATILAVANPSDEATKLGYWWMDRFTKYAASKNHKVIFQKTPTLPVLYDAIVTYDPDMIVVNGHGGSKSLRVGENILVGMPGYDHKIHKNISKGNVDYFSGRITLLLTCNAGRELVKELVVNGATASMGYREPFIFMSDENLPPEQDQSAKPFFEALLQPAIQLADGATFQKAMDATREAYKYYIEQETDPESLRYLKFDLENLVAYGDPNVKLT